MKKITRFKGVICLFVILAGLSLPVAGSATIIGGPGTLPGYGMDDGSTAFIFPDIIIAVEAYDFLGGISAFGFYEISSPETLVPIFEPTDQGPPLQMAYIDFLSGGVVDLDDLSLQGSISTPTEAIGFYLNIGGFVLYSDPVLNGGTDHVGTFPHLIGPDTYEITFEIENPDNSDLVAVASYTIAPAIVVPEPSSLLLIFSGLIGFTFFNRDNRARRKSQRVDR